MEAEGFTHTGHTASRLNVLFYNIRSCIISEVRRDAVHFSAGQYSHKKQLCPRDWLSWFLNCYRVGTEAVNKLVGSKTHPLTMVWSCILGCAGTRHQWYSWGHWVFWFLESHKPSLMWPSQGWSDPGLSPSSTDAQIPPPLLIQSHLEALSTGSRVDSMAFLFAAPVRLHMVYALHRKQLVMPLHSTSMGVQAFSCSSGTVLPVSGTRTSSTCLPLPCGPPREASIVHFSKRLMTALSGLNKVAMM